VKREKFPISRVYVLVAVMAVWALTIGARLYYLQVLRWEHYMEKAQEQQQKVIKTSPRRGDILDRDGNALAISVQVDSIYARPNEMKNAPDTARKLAKLTGLSSRDLVKKLDPSNTWVWVKRKVSPEEREAVEKAKLAGVYFQKEFRRFYPNREMAAHVLGYVDVDEEGQTGLEKAYNEVVLGKPAEIHVMVDGRGKTYQSEQEPPPAGATLTTTLDSTIQYIIERELRVASEQTKANRITIVVMDPNSGAILGMASNPTYNPNRYKDSPVSVWSQNPAVSLTYEPGSTFKMVTIGAAIEEGLTTPDEVIYCEDGSIVVHGRRIRDHKAYGLLSVREIMQNSSNVGTIKLALRVGEDRLATYINRLGFGQKTSVDLPVEASGTVRNVANWSKTSAAYISIGQEISVTPLQVASLISTMANGGIHYKPYLVQKIDDPRGGVIEIKPAGERVLSTETTRKLQNMLEDVVTDGTAKTSQLDGYRAAGKTGTAQKFDPAIGAYSKTKFVGSFAGFAPFSDPQIAIVVIVDEPKGLYYGGEVAAPVFKRVAEQILHAKAVPPDSPRTSPNVVSTPEKQPAAKPREPKPKAKSEFKVVEAALSVPYRGESQSVIGFGALVVPDFSGQSLRQATEAIRQMGLTSKTTGSGRVVGQSPPAGARVRPGARIELSLSLQQ